MDTFSKMRCWSWWEVLYQVLQQFGDEQPFLEEMMVTSVGKHFVKSTYQLEGDKLLVLECYKIIASLKAVIHTGQYPNVQEISHITAASSLALQQQWFTYAMTSVQPHIEYFQDKFGYENWCPLAAFKETRLLSPPRVHKFQFILLLLIRTC